MSNPAARSLANMILSDAQLISILVTQVEDADKAGSNTELNAVLLRLFSRLNLLKMDADSMTDDLIRQYGKRG